MSSKEKDLVARLLKQSILTLCKETVSFTHNLEVDGIISITLENESQHIVIKVHEYFQKVRDDPTLQSLDSTCDVDGTVERYEKQPRVTNIVQRKGYTETYCHQQQGDVSVSNRLRSPSTGKFTKSVQKAWSDDYLIDACSPLPSGDDAMSAHDVPSSMTSSYDLGSTAAESDLDDMDDDYEYDTKYDPGQHLMYKSLISGHLVPVKKPIVNRLMSRKLVANARRNPKVSTAVRLVNGEPAKSVSSGSVTHPTGSVVSSLQPKNIRCKRCGEVSADGPGFVHHNLNVHNVFTCQICYNTFTCRNNMKRHIRLHTGYKPYQCSLCSESFTRKDDIKRHLIRHSYSKPFRCNLCGKGYMDRKTIKAHMRKEHLRKLVHVCPTCGESFDDEEKFQLHKKDHPELKVFQCSVCRFTGSNSLMYNKHMLIHDDTNTFECKACDLDFDDPFKYTNHLKRHRYKAGFTTYQCCFCHQVCGTYDQFVKHEYTHTQVKRHTCTICTKHFRYPSNLREHMVTHGNQFMHGTTTDALDIGGLTPSHEKIATPEQDQDGIKMHSVDQHVECNGEFYEADENLQTDSSSQYWCAECQQGFQTEDKLTEHITVTHEITTQPSRSVGETNQNWQHTQVDQSSTDSEYTPPSGCVAPPSGGVAPPSGGVAPPSGGVAPSLATTDASLILARTLKQTAKMSRQRIKIGDNSYRDLVLKQEPSSDSEGASGDRHQSPDNSYSSNVSITSANASVTSQPDPMDTGPVFPQNGDLEHKLLVQPAPLKLSVRSPGFERVVTPVVLFKQEESFTCDVCRDVSPDFELYEKHNNAMHRRFLCEYCGKSFTSKPNRDRHVRYHTGERPFKCELCSKSFFRGDDLKYHRTTRHAEVKPFSCSKCTMSFAWHNDLERHLKTHRA